MPKLIKKKQKTKTKAVVNKGVAPLAFPAQVGVGTIRKRACRQSGGLPVWTALRPPSRQEGPRASSIKRQDDEQQAHDNYTHSKSFPLHHLTPH